MNRAHVALIITSAVISLAACGGEADGEGAGMDDDPLVAASQLALAQPAGPSAEASVPSALAPNAINPNALAPNALNPSALSGVALDPSALSVASISALQMPDEAGDLSRQFMAYAVSCAFESSQSFSFSWTDSFNVVHNETYWGLLGLAPTWRTQPLGVDGQQWVSACLASRVNYYGVSVILSSRGDNPTLGCRVTTHNEISTYTYEEGAFWGNLFTASPAVYACNYAPNKSYAYSKKRDCAAGHLLDNGSTTECGIIHVVGPCSTYCAPLTSTTLYHPSCATDPANSATATGRAITIFLQ
jgi:hypothetical protein